LTRAGACKTYAANALCIAAVHQMKTAKFKMVNKKCTNQSTDLLKATRINAIVVRGWVKMAVCDMHLHTTASDGTDTPEEMMKRVRDAGIRTFALTDHDTIDGAMELAPKVPGDMTFYRGIEFSCLAKNGKVHILGYNYNPENAVFRDALAFGERQRHRKLDIRIAYLEEKFGIHFSNEELEKLHAIPRPGKPHLADLLVRKGYAANITEAIKKYLNGCRSGISRIGAETAVKAILSAGGIPVWAHPLGGEGEAELPRETFEKTLDELMDYGIQGLECWYSRYTEEQVDFLLAAAKMHGLLISGGSDCHGTRKTIAAGTLNAFGAEVGEEQLTILTELAKRK